MTVLEYAASTPRLETERLYLCRITEEDAPQMYRYARQKKVTRYLTWNPHKSIFQTRAYIRLLQEKYDSAEFYDWGIHVKDTGLFVGTCGFTKIDPHTMQGEIGYVLSPRVWGNGYAREAAEAVMLFGFSVLGLESLSARFIYGNTQSERVMQKLKMNCMGILPEPMFIKNEWKTVIEYKIEKDEFLNQKETLQ